MTQQQKAVLGKANSFDISLPVDVTRKSQGATKIKNRENSVEIGGGAITRRILSNSANNIYLV